VVRLEFAQVAKRVLEQGISLQLTEAAIDYLLKEGYNPKFGARPIRRTIEGKIEDHLSEAILKGEFSLGTTLAIDVETIPGATPLDKPEVRLVFRRVEVPDETVVKTV
jgi:ATP-dependent Clp protease ATP-binding subunit ClpC